MAFTGVTNARGPSLDRVFGLQQEVTRPKARFKPTLPEKFEVDKGAIRCQHILLSYFTCDLI